LKEGGDDNDDDLKLQAEKNVYVHDVAKSQELTVNFQHYFAAEPC
jgi:hypothetical protein